MMPTNASQVFDFLDQHPTGLIERHEIASPEFGALRRSLRSIWMSLRDVDDGEANDVSDRLRMLLSEWLTVPIPFDDAILDALLTFGNPDTVEAKWGQGIRSAYETALEAALELPSGENPIRAKLRAAIRELRTQGQAFKIYCHRSARPHFASLFVEPDTPLDEEAFIHSVRDYREVEPLDVLIKVGPLRSRGWGSAPDALLCAPRFRTLIQIVWSGCGDEPGFGYDPVVPPAELAVIPINGPATSGGSLGNRISWTSIITQSGKDAGTDAGGVTGVDEFQIFDEARYNKEHRRATLVQIDAGQGILYPPHSQVLSFDPSPYANNPIRYRLPGELLEGMFIILPIHSDVDLGGSPKIGTYSSTWKTRLDSEYRADPNGLVKRLHAGGVNLLYLHASIDRWRGSPADVLPAPGHSKHFQILVDVLDVGWSGDIPPRLHGVPWWKCAWNEIRHARGEAIQSGRGERVLIDEELLCNLNELLADISNLSKTDNAFCLPIKDGRSLRGIFRFFKVCSVEDGFLAPDGELKLVRELNTIDQWRE
jgi:hypothetical protein